MTKKGAGPSGAGGKIRPAGREDLEAVLEVLNVTNKACYEAIVPAATFRDPYLSAGDLAEEFARKVFTVYELETQPVGAAAFEARPLAIGVVDRVYVLPAFQRRGG